VNKLQKLTPWLFGVLVLVTIATWGPIFWDSDPFGTHPTQFIESWSHFALKLFYPWLMLLVLFFIGLFSKEKSKSARIILYILLLLFALVVGAIGPLLHVCFLGIDCL
jgi:hypothetical protein